MIKSETMVRVFDNCQKLFDELRAEIKYLRSLKYDTRTAEEKNDVIS